MNTENIIKELKPIDYVVEEKTIMLLFDKNKILILNNFDDKIMFSFFIDRNLIDANIEDENIFIPKFKKYIEAGTQYCY
jgi:hypothetical protein